MIEVIKNVVNIDKRSAYCLQINEALRLLLGLVSNLFQKSSAKNRLKKLELTKWPKSRVLENVLLREHGRIRGTSCHLHNVETRPVRLR